MHRFFLGARRPLYLDAGAGTVSAEAEPAHQIATVLRLRSGDRIEILDGNGYIFLVELTQVGRSAVQGRLIEQRLASGEPRTFVTLYQGLLKGERFEWALQKCTEVGVSAFVPVLCERSVARPADSSSKQTRWSNIVLEAAEQARRGRVPALEPLQPFSGACKEKRSALRLLCWEGEHTQTLQAALRGVSEPLRMVDLFVGPEGSFSEDEVRLAQNHGIQPVTLGQRILRAETAGLVATTIVLYELNDMQ